MALVLADRVLETTTSTGSGTITLAGAEPGYQSFAVVGNGNETYYTIAGDTEWEVGIGTYTSSGTTLSRDTVLSSSDSGNKVTFSAGVKKVFVTYPAEKSVNRDVSGNISASSAIITNVADPVIGSDAANKAYVDNVASAALHVHEQVVLATPTNSGRNDTYNNGTAGVSATLTATANGTLVIDSTVAQAAQRVLIKDCDDQVENGIYVVTTVGDGSNPYVMTRSSDADTSGESNAFTLDEGSYFFVTGGTTQKGAAYVCNTSTLIIFGTTSITFAEFSQAQVYSAGNGISLTNTTISLDTPVSVANGGTGLSTTPTSGQLLIGNGSNYTLSTLTAGSGVSITNSAGSITLSATGSGGTVVEVKATSPLASSGGTSPTISIANSTGTGSVVLDQGATISSATITAAVSASITTITGTSANITTVSGTTARFSSAAITQLSGTSAGITTVSGTTTTFSSGTITQFGATSATIASVSGTNVTYSNGNFTSATITTVSGTTATYTSATVTNLNSTSANITTLTGTTFGTTATTQLRGASAQITTLSGTTATFTSASVTNLALTSLTLANLSLTSANITTLTGTTFGTTATTQLRGASGQITTLTSTSANITTLTGTTLTLSSRLTAAAITTTQNAAYTAFIIARGGASPSTGTISNSGNLLDYSYNGTAITFSTGATPSEQVRITSAGLVGIKKAPSTALDVSGTITGTTLSGTTITGTSGTITNLNSTSANITTLTGTNLSYGSLTLSGGANITGNVGIGTTTPSTILSFGGEANRIVGMERRTTANTAGAALTLRAGGATSGATDKNGGTLALSGGTATGSGSSIITFSTATAGAAGTADVTPTEKVRIDGAGNVGIGVAPDAALSVKGISNGLLAKFGGNAGVYGRALQINEFAVGGTNSVGFQFNSPGSGGVAALSFATVGTDRLYVNSSGNVGIGTTNPTFKFVAANSGTDGAWLYSSSAISYLGLGGYANGGDGAFQIIYNRGTGGITFNGGSRDTPAARMTIDSSGNVGIGTASPTARLDINNQDAAETFPLVLSNSIAGISIATAGIGFNAHGVRFAQIVGGQQTNNTFADGTLRFFTRSAEVVAERLRIASAGQIGIGGANYGTSGQVLTSNGSGSAPSWQSISGLPSANVTTSTAITATAGTHYILRGASATVTLPSSPAAGAVVWITVANSLTVNKVARNGSNIQGLAEDMTLNSRFAAVQLRYSDATMGWIFC